MSQRLWSVTPKTSGGWWSIILIIVMPLLFFAASSFALPLYQSIPGGDTIPADLAARPAFALTMLAGLIAGILAFVTGLLAILRRQERALLVYASTVIGALVVLLLLGDILFPD